VTNHIYEPPARYTFRYDGDARQNRTMVGDPADRRGRRIDRDSHTAGLSARLLSLSLAPQLRATAHGKGNVLAGLSATPTVRAELFDNVREVVALQGDVYGCFANNHGQTVLRTRTSFSVFYARVTIPGTSAVRGVSLNSVVVSRNSVVVTAQQ
jgi:hypothetical protein